MDKVTNGEQENLQKLEKIVKAAGAVGADFKDGRGLPDATTGAGDVNQNGFDEVKMLKGQESQNQAVAESGKNEAKNDPKMENNGRGEGNADPYGFNQMPGALNRQKMSKKDQKIADEKSYPKSLSQLPISKPRLQNEASLQYEGSPDSQNPKKDSKEDYINRVKQLKARNSKKKQNGYKKVGPPRKMRSFNNSRYTSKEKVSIAQDDTSDPTRRQTGQENREKSLKSRNSRILQFTSDGQRSRSRRLKSTLRIKKNSQKDAPKPLFIRDARASMSTLKRRNPKLSKTMQHKKVPEDPLLPNIDRGKLKNGQESKKPEKSKKNSFQKKLVPIHSRRTKQHKKSFGARLDSLKPTPPYKNTSKKPKNAKTEEKSKKVFIVSKAYKCIKQELLNRGWHENPELSSTNFNLKFVVRYIDVDFKKLSKTQIVNHFEHAPSTLTTKVGLARTLKNVKTLSGTSNIETMDDFFPKCFYSEDEENFQSFLDYYKLLRAESVLKKYLELAILGVSAGDEFLGLEEQVEVAERVTRRRMCHLGEVLEAGRGSEGWVAVTDEEWRVLSRGDRSGKKRDSVLLDDEKLKRFVKVKLKKEEKRKLRKKIRKQKKKAKMNKKLMVNGYKASIEPSDHPEDDQQILIEQKNSKTQELTEKQQNLQKLVSKLEKHFPQTKMNGCENIWILKPSGLSRGRGIRLYSSLSDIVQHLKSSEFSWVVQKYMENPLLYNNKKIDIRQWVLVTDFNPLTIWFYEECYIRISTGDYTLKNIKDRYIHLTNNSVNKKAENFRKEDGFMSQEEMEEWLERDFGEGAFRGIQRQMKEQVVASLQAATESVVSRKNSNSIYGYDFCIDLDLRVWLIEVNSSPDFSFSSDVTEQLVRKASEDFVKVVLDYNSKKKRKKNSGPVDTGLFKRIYKAKPLDKNIDYFNLDLTVQGTKLAKKKFRRLCEGEDRKFHKKVREGSVENEEEAQNE